MAGKRQKLKDKKITLYGCVWVDGQFGDTTVVYKPMHPGKLWAYVRQLSGQERYAAMSLQIEEETIFIINWRKDLSTADAAGSLYLEHKASWYSITRIDTFEGYKQDLQLYGKLERFPDSSDLLPYNKGGQE